MPYVDPGIRGELDNHPQLAGNPGELNYVLTCVVARYVKRNGLNYTTINDVLGALDGCSKEFYRRVAAPYEDGKIAQNGDVYPDSWE